MMKYRLLELVAKMIGAHPSQQYKLPDSQHAGILPTADSMLVVYGSPAQSSKNGACINFNCRIGQPGQQGSDFCFCQR
jgi:hypothetical protein